MDGDSLPNPGAPLYWRAKGALYRLRRRRARVPLVISFPKSGRTWLRVMLDELGIDPEFSHAGSHVRLGLPIERLAVRERWCAGRPTLLLVRDPRDTVVSWYFQATRRRGFFVGSLSDFIRHPGHGLEKIVRFNSNWAEASLDPREFRVLDYAQLRAEPASRLGALCRFFGREASPERIEAAVAGGDFEVMKQREAEGIYQGRYARRLEPGDRDDPESFKVRRGVVGGFRDYLADADLAYCDEVFAKHDYWTRIAAASARLGLGVGARD